MKYPLHLLVCEDTVTDDEIDELFDKLEVIEPPARLVGDILSSVSRLSQQPLAASSLLKGVEGLVVCHDMYNPS